MPGPEFGNNELEGLHELTIPDPVSYTPQTIGWYILLAVVLICALWLGYRWYRRRVTNRYRVFALRRLEDIEQQLTRSGVRSKALRAFPALVKQTALACYPRSEVANLSGKEWLFFLDTSYGGQGFYKGAGRLLPDLSYQPDAYLENISDENINELISLIRHWIKVHRARI